jgi:flagellar FliL protein
VAKDKSKDKGKADKAAADAEDKDLEATTAEGGGEGEAAGEGEGEGGKKKLPLKMILIAAAGALVVLGGGGGAAFFLFAPKAAPAHGHKLPPKPKGDKKDGKADPSAPQVRDGPDGVVFYTLPDLVVNMQTPDNKPTFLKLKLTFELPDHDTADSLDPQMPRLQDMFQTFLRELRPEDLSGSQGTFQLRMELQRRVNLLIAPSKVNAVLIEEMLIN